MLATLSSRFIKALIFASLYINAIVGEVGLNPGGAAFGGSAASLRIGNLYNQS
jgi:hypothetical protein